MKLKKGLSIVLTIVFMISTCFPNNVFAMEKTSDNTGKVFTGDLEEINFTEFIVSAKAQRGLFDSSSVKLIRGTTYHGEALGDDFYFYRNMLTDREKKAYDIVKNGLISASEKIWIATTQYSTFTITVDEMKKILSYVIFDSPEIFWCDLNFGIATYSNEKVAYVVPKYNGLMADIQTYQEQIDNQLKHAFEVMSTFSTDIAKVKYAHDYLVHTIDYVSDSEYNQNIYSSIMNKESVCAGYAKGFQYMMQKMEIPCTYVSGTANGGPHAWNILLLDGECYAMDVTWDDPVFYNASGEMYYDSNYYDYTYFNVTDQFLEEKAHIRGEYSDELSVATGTKYSYANYYHNDAYGTDFDAVEVIQTTTVGNNTTEIPGVAEEYSTVNPVGTTEEITTLEEIDAIVETVTTTEQNTTAKQSETTVQSTTTEHDTTTEQRATTEQSTTTEAIETKVTIKSEATSEQITKPAKVKIKKIFVKKRKLTILWKKGKKGVRGYQIQYSTNKKFKKTKTRIIKQINKLSMTTNKLKKGKIYYVRIRTYAMSGKRKIYSDWSKIKKKRLEEA